LAIRSRNMELLKRVIDSKYFVPQKAEDRLGNTILHLATLHSNFEAVRMIIEKGVVAIDHENSVGRTALDIATTYKLKRIKKYLKMKSKQQQKI